MTVWDQNSSVFGTLVASQLKNDTWSKCQPVTQPQSP